MSHYLVRLPDFRFDPKIVRPIRALKFDFLGFSVFALLPNFHANSRSLPVDQGHFEVPKYWKIRKLLWKIGKITLLYFFGYFLCHILGLVLANSESKRKTCFYICIKCRSGSFANIWLCEVKKVKRARYNNK